MPAVTIACPSCGASLRVPANVPAGKTAKCPKCASSVPLPGPSDSSLPQAGSSLADSRGATANDRTGAFPHRPQSDDAVTSFLAPPEVEGELGRLGAYRVLEVLGKGGMGVVFKAKDTGLRREVALKVMLPQVAANATAKARFIREARAQAAIEHENVIAIYQVEEDNGVPFLAMPLLRGQTLQAALKLNATPPIPEVLRIGREMALGLAAAHELGLIHRDIKPANVWLEGAKRRVKILDFGLARSTEVDAADDTDGPVTREGSTLGTPAYMSPEQARGTGVDARTDLFSLGVVLYQMCTGELPFKGNDVMAILMSLATETPPLAVTKNPDVPPALSGLVASLLAKDATARPPTAEAVAEELLAIENGQKYATYAPAPVGAENDPFSDLYSGEEDNSVTLTATAGSGGVIRPAPRRARPKDGGGDGKPNRKPLYIGGGVAALLALVVVVWLVARPSSKPKPADIVENKDPPKPAVSGPQYSLAFHGGGFVEAPPFSLPATGGFTIEAYVAASPNPRNYDLVGQNGGCKLFKSGDRIAFQYEGVNGGCQPSAVLPTGQRVHVAGVKTDTEARIYLNGKLISRNSHGSPNVQIATEPWRIGSPDFYGLLDEVRISQVARYDADFTPTSRFEPDRDTLALYHCDAGRGTSLRDFSGRSRDGLISDVKWAKTGDPLPVAPPLPTPEPPPPTPAGTWWKPGESPPPGDYALSYDGTARVDVPTISFPATAPMTLEAYVTPQTDNVKGIGIVAGKHGANSIYFSGLGVKTMYRGSFTADLAVPFDKDRRIHLAGVRTPTQILMFINGKLAASKDGEGLDILQGTGWILGEANYIGIIDEVRVSNVARYTAEFTPAARFEPDANTLALYHFDEGVGDQLKDSSGNNHHGNIVGAKWVKADGSPIPPPAAAAPQPTDILKLADPAATVIRGNWERRGADLAASSPTDICAINVPFDLPEEYDLTVDFTRTAAEKSVSVIVPWAGKQVQLHAGNDGRSFSVYTKAGTVNAPREIGVVNGQRNSVRFEVRKASLTIHVNGTKTHELPASTETVISWADVLEKPSQPKLALNTGSAVFHRMDVSPPVAPGNPAAIDLLARVDPGRDMVNGTWEKKGNDLVGRGPGYNVIELPYKPGGEYDFIAEFTRTEAVTWQNRLSFENGLIATYNGRPFRFVMSARDGWFLIHDIKGRPIGSNPAAQRPDLAMVLNRRYTAKVEVRKDRVIAYLDGNKIDEHVTDYSDLTLFPPCRLRDDNLIGLEFFGGSQTYHRIEVVEVTGKGSHRVAAPVPAPAGIDLLRLADPAKDTAAGKWERRGTEIFAEGNGQVVNVLELPYKPPEEYDLSAEFTRSKGNAGIALALVHGGRSFEFTASAGGKYFGFGLVKGKEVFAQPEYVREDLAFNNNEKHVIRAEVRKDRVSAFLDGRKVAEIAPEGLDLAMPASGKLRDETLLGLKTSSHVNVTFHKAEIVEVTGKGAATRAAPPVSLLPMIDPAQDTVSGPWSRKGEEIALEATPGNRILEMPYVPPLEYDILMEFTRTGGREEVSIAVNRQGRSCRWVQCARGDVFGFSMVDGQMIGSNPEYKKPDLAFVNDRRYQTKVEVRKDRLAAYVDGKLVQELKTDGSNLSMSIKLRDDYLPAIVAGGGVSVVIHKLEIVDVTGQGSTLRSTIGFQPDPADRKAAEALHSHATLGLRVADGRTLWVPIHEPLPAEPFVLTRINFNPAPKYPTNYASAVLLPALAGVKDLTALEDGSRRFQVTPAEFQTLAAMPFAPRLTRLAMNVPITSATWDSLAKFPRLQFLMGGAEDTDDAVLARLPERVVLRELGLRGFGTSGLPTAKGWTALASLRITRFDLTRLQVTDPAFAATLAQMPELTSVGFALGEVNDGFLMELAKSPKITGIEMGSTKVTDAGLLHLAGMVNLRGLGVNNTAVTEAGARKLAASLPLCRIAYPGGVVDPNMK